MYVYVHMCAWVCVRIGVGCGWVLCVCGVCFMWFFTVAAPHPVHPRVSRIKAAPACLEALLCLSLSSRHWLGSRPS